MAEDERLRREQRPIEDGRPPYEEKFRRYLLGLSPPDEAANVERGILEEEHPILEVIEDELVEDYVTGELSGSDRSHFEQRFLFSQERVEKIRLSAMLLGRPDVVDALVQRVENLHHEHIDTGPRTEFEFPQPDLTNVLGMPMDTAVVGERTGPSEIEPNLGSSPASVPHAPAPSAKHTGTRMWFAVAVVAILGAWLFAYSFQHFYQMPPPPASSPMIGANPVPYLASAEVSVASPQPAHNSAPPPGYRTYRLTLHGSGFVKHSVVRCNGVVEFTVFIGPSELWADTEDLSESDYEKLRGAEVVVTNPPPIGGASSPVKVSVGKRPAP